MKRPPRKPQGWTLVELLLALAIGAALMAPLAALFQASANSNIAAGTALDLNTDARFALERIATRAAAAALPATGPGGIDANVLQTAYTVAGGKLVEADTQAVIASNVAAFKLSLPDNGAGQPLLKIDLTLAAGSGSVSASRTVRIGGLMCNASP